MNPFGYSAAESGPNQFTSYSPASTYPSYPIRIVGHSNDVLCATEHKIPEMMPSPTSNSLYISFQNLDLSPDISQQHPGTYELQDVEEGMKMKRSGDGTLRRTTLHAQEHVIAERKRREKMSQRFIALSASLPGLKKMDKASVLGATIEYLKQLEERVKVLEEEVARRTVESVILVKKQSLRLGDNIASSLSEENFDNPIIDQQLPEVKVRASGKNVLIKVQCEKREGCIKEVIKQMEDMNLTTLNSSVLAFGSSLLDVTIAAQIDNENCPTTEEIVKKVRRALMTFI